MISVDAIACHLNQVLHSNLDDLRFYRDGVGMAIGEVRPRFGPWNLNGK
jgi:hypothetical protein